MVCTFTDIRVHGRGPVDYRLASGVEEICGLFTFTEALQPLDTCPTRSDLIPGDFVTGVLTAFQERVWRTTELGWMEKLGVGSIIGTCVRDLEAGIGCGLFWRV